MTASTVKFQLPQNIEERTTLYLNKSFPILRIFDDLYIKTGVKSDIIKLKDVYEKIKHADLFYGFDKVEKRKYSYKYFSGFVEKNKTFREHYYERLKINGNDYFTVLSGYVLRDSLDEGNNSIEEIYGEI